MKSFKHRKGHNEQGEQKESKIATTGIFFSFFAIYDYV
jgi:hypothetical protein